MELNIYRRETSIADRPEPLPPGILLLPNSTTDLVKMRAATSRIHSCMAEQSSVAYIGAWHRSGCSPTPPQCVTGDVQRELGAMPTRLNNPSMETTASARCVRATRRPSASSSNEPSLLCLVALPSMSMLSDSSNVPYPARFFVVACNL